MGRSEAALVRRALATLREAQSVFPALRARFRLDAEAGTEGRQFGFYDEGSRVVGLAPRLARASVSRQKGILRHELGHAIASQYTRESLARVLGPLPAGEEGLADLVAGFVWGEPIRYDSEAVQSTSDGSPIRPGFLHR